MSENDWRLAEEREGRFWFLKTRKGKSIVFASERAMKKFAKENGMELAEGEGWR